MPPVDTVGLGLAENEPEVGCPVTDARGLGVAKGVGRSPTSDSRRRFPRTNDAGLGLWGGVGFVIWVVGTGVAGLVDVFFLVIETGEGKPEHPSSSSSSSSTSVPRVSAMVEIMDAVAGLRPKLSRLPAPTKFGRFAGGLI